MTAALGGAVAGVLFLLSLLHVFWALGGRWGASAALPESRGGKPLPKPGPLLTLAVAAALALAALVELLRAGLFAVPPSAAPYVSAAAWGVAVVFAARTIGDFRVFGLFKKERGTRFSRWDDRLFTPLCAALAAAAAAIALMPTAAS